MFIAPILRKHNPDLDTDVRLPEIKEKIPQLILPKDLLPVIKGTGIELPCLLAMWLSLTMSEIRGLTKSKSINNGQLIIVETVVDVKGKPIRKEGGKEEKRTRALDIPPYLQTLIDAVEGDVIVPQTNAAIYKRLQRLLEKNNLPPMSFHALRHLNATVMSSLNVPSKIAQNRGGWKTEHTMNRVYTHEFSEERKAADERIDNYFNNILNPPDNNHESAQD